MLDAFIFWLAAPLAFVALWGAALLVVGLGLALAALKRHRKQSKCPHNRVHEDSKRDAWCIDCGKNCGFIRTWRER